jgi:hypothetical protein
MLANSHGGAEEIRTPDLCSAIAALSQLSYSPRRRSLRDRHFACKRVSAIALRVNRVRSRAFKPLPARLGPRKRA